MAANIELSTLNFFKSNQIKIYPASFRGVYGENNTKFDPESTLTTEYNITRPLMAGDKETYVVSWDETERKLTCVIGGYYFEISNVTASALANKYLCITKRSVDLTDTSDTDSQRTTSVLASFRGNSVNLDESNVADGYFFTGLLISDTAAGEFRLKAFLENGAINYSEFMPNLKSGDGNANNQPTSLIFGDGAKATANRSIAVGDGAEAEGEHSLAFGSDASSAGAGAVAIGHGANASVENAIALGNNAQATAEGAVAIGTETKASGADSCAYGYKTGATGKYAQASGNQTKAVGEASVADGNNTIAEGDYSHASGNNAAARGICSTAFGNNTTAGFANQFVLGAFNNNNENNIFEIGNGTAKDQPKNIFEIDKEGKAALNSLKASGNIEVEGTAKLGNKVEVKADGVSLTAPTTFAECVKLQKKLTISDDIEVTGKLKTENSQTTIFNTLNIEDGGKTNGNYKLVYDAKAGSLAIGNHLNKGKGSVAFTSGSDATGINAFTIGQKNSVSGENSAAFGANNKVSGSGSFASGNSNNVTGTGAVALGSSNKNAKLNAAVFGVGNTANSDYEVVFGCYNEELGGQKEYFAIGDGDPNIKKTVFAVKAVTDEKTSKTGTELFIDNKSVATHVSEDTGFKEFLLNSLYPVGSVYIYSGARKNLALASNNGNVLCPIQHTLGGTWEAIENYFLYAGDQELRDEGINSYYNCINHEGGSNEAYIVEHSHAAIGTYNGCPTQTIDSWGNEKTLKGKFLTGRGECERTLHAVPGQNPTKNTSYVKNGIVKVYSGYSNYWTLEDSNQTLQEVQLRPLQSHRPDQIEIDASHWHKMSTTEVNINVKNINTPEVDKDHILGRTKIKTANMPKYLCVYAWKRVK